MSDSNDLQELKKHEKFYWIIFWGLILGTLVTVGLYYVEFNSIAVTVAIAMVVASVKGFLVAGFFMHLTNEKKTIYSIMAVTVLFFIALMFLFIWTYKDIPTSI